jgi:hypothetical protein
MTINALIAFYFAVASIWALIGTNAQAALSRERLLTDPDEAIARAGRLWHPMPWASRKSVRRKRSSVEDAFRNDPDRWQQYTRLRQELSAWNMMESAVAMAFGGSLLAILAVFID